MADGKTSKGIVADGGKIKALRKQVGHTQKGLISGTGIEIRTYQRAEQGKPILPEILQHIAIVLKVDVNEIRKSALEDNSPPNTLRLQCAAQVGARKLIEELQSGLVNRVRYTLKIDPSSENSERAATLIEKCQSLEVKVKGREDRRLGLAPQIRMIGELNDLIKEVSNIGINLYFASYYEYEVEECSNCIISADITGGDEVTPYDTSLTQHLWIELSHETTPTINKRLPLWSTKEEAVKRAIKRNLAKCILPEWLEGSDFFMMFSTDGLVEAYRLAFAEKFPLLVGRKPDME